MKTFLIFGSAMLFAFGFESSAQVKLTSATLGTIEARSVGPSVMGGRISAIEGVAKTPRILYVGAAGGGVEPQEGGFSGALCHVAAGRVQEGGRRDPPV